VSTTNAMSLVHVTDASTRLGIGIDVGGTKIAAGLVEHPSGRALSRRIVPTLPRRGGEAVLASVRELAIALADEARAAERRIDGIGIGVCELVDAAGIVLSDATIAWRGLPIALRFSDIAPTTIEADARAGALAEARLGAGRGLRSFLYVTIGTGIGSSFVVDGVPWTGERGATGTIASGPFTSICSNCGELSRSVLEEVASGPALVERYRRESTSPIVSSADVCARAEQGDAVAERIVETAGRSLGGVLALLVGVLDPGAIVLGGGLGAAVGPYARAVEEELRRAVWSDLQRGIPVTRAQLGEESGWIGAAWAALEAFPRVPSTDHRMIEE
jgi:glucokinase